MFVVRADSTVASYVEACAIKKELNRAKNLLSGAMASLMSFKEQKVMPKLASALLNQCLQLLKDALQLDLNNKIGKTKIKLKAV